MNTVSSRLAGLFVAALSVALTVLPALPGPAAGAATRAAALTAADVGTFTSTLFPAPSRYPGSGAQRSVVRDCGLSTALPDGKTLWVFCDTATYDNVTGVEPNLTATVGFVGSGTAALAATTPDPSVANPVALHEATAPAYDKAFVTSSGTYGATHQPISCAGHASPVAWSNGLVTLPGTSTVLDFFQDHCPDPAGGYPGYDVGVATYTAPATAAGDFTGADHVQATAQYNSVLVNPNPGSATPWGYGSGAVADATYVYLYGVRPGQYSCTSSSSCTLTTPGAVTVARVPWAGSQFTSAANYQYYTGSAAYPWVADPSKAVDVLPDQGWPAGDGLSVAWYPQLGRYVMAHGDSPLGAGSGMSVRTSTTPWGPWSAPLDVAPQAQSSLANPAGGCTAPTTCRTFLLHPDLTGSGSTLYFSYVRNGDIAAADGSPVTIDGAPTMQVRLGSIPLSALPVPAPDTRILTAPTDPSNVDPASFTFGVNTRPTTPGDPPGMPAGTTGPITYLCALDGAAATPCTSPRTYPGLANGRHTVSVQAVSGLGMADPTPATWSWSVDRSAPNTIIQSGPPSPSDQGASVFRFTGLDDQTMASGLRFLCSLDGTAPVVCTSPFTPTGLTSGSHTVLVAAVDRAGNVDLTPATWTWTVDTDPVITVTSGPPPYTASTSASIAFTATDDHTATASLATTCSLDAAPFTACSSPVSVADLSIGAHAMTIHTTDNLGHLGTVTWSWVVETQPPTAVVTADVSGSVSRTSATMTLTGTDAQAPPSSLVFRCSLDGAAFASCTSPVALTGLSSGTHTFAAEAVNPAGSVSSPTSVSWSVDTAAPVVSIGAGPATTTTATAASIPFSATDDQTPVAQLAFRCSIDGTDLGACTSPLTLTGLLPGAHVAVVQATDAAGNTATASTTWTVQFAIVAPAPASAYTGIAYAHTFATNEPASPSITYQVTSGTLPPSLMLDPGGLLQGTPGSAHDYGSVTVTATSPWGTATQTFPFQVLSTTSITGTVANRDNGAPVAGIRVRAFDPNGLIVATSTSDTNGAYSMGYLKPGSYRLSFVDTTLLNFVPDYSGDAATLATATPVAVSDGSSVPVNATLVPLNVLRGVVTDAVTGSVLPGRRATLYNASGTAVTFTTTAQDGSYTFTALADGTYKVGFTDPSLAYITQYWAGRATVAAADPIVVSGGTTATANVGLQPYGSITGTVTDAGTKSPLAAINVTLLNPSGVAIGLAHTQANGTYAFSGLVPGTYSLGFGDPTGQHVLTYWNNAATAATATPINLQGGSVTADAQLVPLATIAGQAVDSVTGAAISGIWVTIFNADGTSRGLQVTSATGSFTFAGLPIGTYRLAFSDPQARYKTQYWSGATSLATATPIVAAQAGVVTANIALVTR